MVPSGSGKWSVFPNGIRYLRVSGRLEVGLETWSQITKDQYLVGGPRELAESDRSDLFLKDHSSFFVESGVGGNRALSKYSRGMMRAWLRSIAKAVKTPG